MPCPHAMNFSREGVSRRGYFRFALAMGGVSAFTACLEREDSLGLPEIPHGHSNPSELPIRQHEWDDYMLRDVHGNIRNPEFQSLLFFDVVNDLPPAEEERDRMEEAFRGIEEAFSWGTAKAGDEPLEANPGVLFTVGYSHQYFDRFGRSLSDDVELRYPEDTLTAINEHPNHADEFDVCIHIATDYPSVLLGVEEALQGNVRHVNGTEMKSDLAGILKRRERRSGFVGRGLPREHIELSDIPENAHNSMGFRSGLRDSLPPEDKVTISSGTFGEGTLQHISKLRIRLDRWYALSADQRVHRMFSPEHSVRDIGTGGEEIGAESGMTRDLARRLDEHADQDGVVGHAQKLSRVRDDDFHPRILRRADFNAADPAGSILHFGALHRTEADLLDTLTAMRGTGEKNPRVSRPDDGILHYIHTVTRGNYLIPPRPARSLPAP